MSNLTEKIDFELTHRYPKTLLRKADKCLCFGSSEDIRQMYWFFCKMRLLRL